jgi:NADPH-dependent 7-cyano-7-deazaguanine reductase QueF-like protein
MKPVGPLSPDWANKPITSKNIIKYRSILKLYLNLLRKKRLDKAIMGIIELIMRKKG